MSLVWFSSDPPTSYHTKAILPGLLPLRLGISQPTDLLAFNIGLPIMIVR